MIKNTIIDELISNLKKIKPETILIRATSSEALRAAEDINRTQLQQGELETGETLPNYAKRTEKVYNVKRKTKVTTADVVKFYDSGAFHKSIKAKITNKGELALQSRSTKLNIVRAYVERKGLKGDVLGLQDHWLDKWYETFVEDNFVKMLTDRILTG